MRTPQSEGADGEAWWAELGYWHGKLANSIDQASLVGSGVSCSHRRRAIGRGRIAAELPADRIRRPVGADWCGIEGALCQCILGPAGNEMGSNDDVAATCRMGTWT